MCRIAQLRKFINKCMPGVGLQFRIREQLLPGDRIQRGSFIGMSYIDRAALGIISFEMRRVYFDASDRPWRAEFHNAPVMPRPASSLRFPAVAHVARQARHYQINAVPE